jgi:hypothetical protein
MNKKKGGCSKVVSSFDVTGPEVLNFTYGGEVNHKTVWGGLGSIIAIVIILAYTG